MKLRPALFLAATALGCAAREPAAAPSPAAAELAKIERQLEGFYGPMIYLVEESRLAIEDVLWHLKREYVFPTDGPLPADELRFWLFRAENDLMPRNEEMVEVVRSGRSLVEGDRLPKILDALVEHQASWRELHRRWKKDGVAYEWRSKTPFPRDLGAAIAREFERLKKRHGELLAQVPGAELRHVGRQIDELYGPLVRQNHEGQLAFSRLLQELNRESVFPLAPAKKDEELVLWLRWCEHVFFPRNEETRRTIRKGFHLVAETGMPPGFRAFLDHWNSWKMEHARWKEQGVDYRMHSRTNFPALEFSGAVEKAWQDLKSRQVRLRGAAADR